MGGIVVCILRTITPLRHIQVCFRALLWPSAIGQMLRCEIFSFITLQSVLYGHCRFLRKRLLFFGHKKDQSKVFNIDGVRVHKVARTIWRKQFHFAPYSIGVILSLVTFSCRKHDCRQFIHWTGRYQYAFEFVLIWLRFFCYLRLLGLSFESTGRVWIL